VEIAATLALSEGAVKVRVHRLRKRFGELLLEALSSCCGARMEIEDEVRHLFAIFAG
jgi:RNA polymerase sigma-70 factor (ECF subfamily)